MIWLVGLAGFALGAGLGYAVSRLHHRRRVEELEDRYTRILPQDAPRKTPAVPVGIGVSRVSAGKVKHRRSHMQS